MEGRKTKISLTEETLPFAQHKRQFGLDPSIFIINLLACAISVCFVSCDFGSDFCLDISRLCSRRESKIK